MSENTKIEWATHTFNTHWGCLEVSPACDNCYARTWAKATGHPAIWGPPATTARRMLSENNWNKPLRWDRLAAEAGERHRVFANSMSDIFEQHPDLDPVRARLWSLIEQTPNLDWLLLTKRPQNIRRMVPAAWLQEPRHNVWYGTTVENQHYADQRIPILLDVPAVVRFLSMEPLLGPVEFSNVTGRSDAIQQLGEKALSGIHWVITGGESGHGSRPADPNWYRSLRDQCVAAGVAFHFKQWGEWLPYEMDAQPPFWRSAADGTLIDGHIFPDGISDGEPVNGWLAGIGPDDPVWRRVGKKTAGRLLDGRTWDETPTTDQQQPDEPAWPPAPIEGEPIALPGFDVPERPATEDRRPSWTA